MGVVPVVDLGGQPNLVARSIDAACREVGFFQIVGHGVDASVETAAWEVAAAFFRLPLNEKLELAIPAGDAYGYGPFEGERLAADRGAATSRDLKETFSVGPFGRPPTDMDSAASFAFSPNRWPAAIPDMETVFRRYYDALATLVARLMSLMAVGLGLPPDHFESSIDRHTSALRALRYPDLADHRARNRLRPGQLRAGAHTDYGTLTLLRQDDAPGGLQVQGAAGTWHDVPAIADAYVVNVGDALGRWTNDRWQSTMHRVTITVTLTPVPTIPPDGVDRDCSRQSMAFFHNANWDAVIECIPSCLAAGESPRYEPIAAGQHLRDRFLSAQS